MGGPKDARAPWVEALVGELVGELDGRLTPSRRIIFMEATVADTAGRTGAMQGEVYGSDVGSDAGGHRRAHGRPARRPWMGRQNGKKRKPPLTSFLKQLDMMPALQQH